MDFVDKINLKAPLENGAYVGVIADLKPRAIDDRGREGVRFALKVTEGGAKGRLAMIELFTEAKARSRVVHDLALLKTWLSILNVTTAGTLVEAIEKLRAASVGKRVEYVLLRNEWEGNLELRLVGVRIAANG